MASFGNYSLGTDPFVGISDEIILWGGKHCAVKRIFVQGKIYDCGSGPNTGKNILNEINNFQDAAMKDYSSISVGGFSAQYARCESLEITNSDYLGAEYRAEFLAYPDNWFAFQFNILEPIDNISVSVGENGLITVTRSVSARASNNKSFDKVFSWISSLNLETPPNISNYGFGSFNGKPKNISQTTDRINGTVSAEVTFVANENSFLDSILTYSIDIQYDDKSGIYTVSINGNLEGHTQSNLSNIRNQIGSIGLFQLAEDAFSKTGSKALLSSQPVTANFSENDENDSVNFSVTYNTLPDSEKKYFDFTIDYDHIKDITTVTISGTISFERIPQKSRSEIIKSLIEDYDFGSLCLSEFNNYSPNPSNQLNIKNPISYSLTINQGEDITGDVSVSYSNEDILPNDFYVSLDYDIQINPSFIVRIPIQFLNGGGGFFDFGASRRGTATIRGSAITLGPGNGNSILDDMDSILRNSINSFSPEDEIYLERNVIFTDVSDNGYQYEFEITIGAILSI
jgi:hypothetical protein